MIALSTEKISAGILANFAASSVSKSGQNIVFNENSCLFIRIFIEASNVANQPRGFLRRLN